MPVYDYRCDTCGPFSRLAPMAAAKEPSPCPYCGETAARIISAPYLACMSPDNRKAWERNERAAHEPKVRRSSCGCSGSIHTCNSGKKATAPKEPAATKPPLQTASKRNSRPWMLGH